MNFVEAVEANRLERKRVKAENRALAKLKRRRLYKSERVKPVLVHEPRPRLECGDKGAKWSCYMYTPVRPFVLEQNEGEDRSLFLPSMIRGRSHACRIAERGTDVDMVGVPLKGQRALITWVPVSMRKVLEDESGAGGKTKAPKKAKSRGGK